MGAGVTWYVGDENWGRTWRSGESQETRWWVDPMEYLNPSAMAPQIRIFLPNPAKLLQSPHPIGPRSTSAVLAEGPWSQMGRTRCVEFAGLSNKESESVDFDCSAGSFELAFDLFGLVFGDPFLDLRGAAVDHFLGLFET